MPFQSLAIHTDSFTPSLSMLVNRRLLPSSMSERSIALIIQYHPVGSQVLHVNRYQPFYLLNPYALSLIWCQGSSGNIFLISPGQIPSQQSIRTSSDILVTVLDFDVWMKTPAEKKFPSSKVIFYFSPILTASKSTLLHNPPGSSYTHYPGPMNPLAYVLFCSRAGIDFLTEALQRLDSWNKFRVGKWISSRTNGILQGTCLSWGHSTVPCG